MLAITTLVALHKRGILLDIIATMVAAPGQEVLVLVE